MSCTEGMRHSARGEHEQKQQSGRETEYELKMSASSGCPTTVVWPNFRPFTVTIFRSFLAGDSSRGSLDRDLKTQIILQEMS